MRKFLFVLIIFTLYSGIFAENITGMGNEKITKNKTDISELSDNTPISLINFFMAMSFVIGLIFLVTYFFKKVYGIKSSGQRGQVVKMSVISNLPLGDKKFLLIVDVAGKYFFVGVTPNSISYLSELSLDIENIKEESDEFKSFFDRAKEMLSGVKK
jgi:flagellar biosynthetic protein FliO